MTLLFDRDSPMHFNWMTPIVQRRDTLTETDKRNQIAAALDPLRDKGWAFVISLDKAGATTVHLMPPRGYLAERSADCEMGRTGGGDIYARVHTDRVIDAEFATVEEALASIRAAVARIESRYTFDAGRHL